MARFFEKLRTRFSDFEPRKLIPGRRILILFSAGFLSMLVLLTGSALYTSRPSFCTSCHYMEPFYESWEMSSHSGVTCTACHFPPGLAGTVHGKLAGLEQVISYIGRSYTRRKPWAEIDDASCLQSGCHETRLLEGTVVFKNVVFDHRHHLGELRRGKELRCTSCHSQVVQGEHILVTESTCFLCHMKQEGDVDFALTERLASCETCHSWSDIPAELMDDFRFDHSRVVEQNLTCTRCHNQTIIGDGFVPRENCNSCHFEPERLERIGDTELLHRVHISQNKIECSQCHLSIQHKIQRIAREAPLECSTCHTETHSEQLSLFTGQDPHAESGRPNPMLDAGLNCASCHLFHEQLIGSAEVRTASPESCEGCHGEGYGRLLGLWEESANKKLVDLRQESARVERTVRSTNTGDLESAQAHLSDARYSMQLVEVGKAVHNMAYADQLIGNSYEHLNSALEAIQAPYRLADWETDAAVPSACANCHAGGETVTTTFQGRTFEHSVHVAEQGLDCQTCHSNAREHGQLIATRQQCMSCHHDPARNEIVDNCVSCHATAAAVYAGTYEDLDLPDFMFDEGIVCEDCHLAGQTVARPQPSVCADCHDDEYPEMLVEWKSEFRDLAADVRSMIDQIPATRRDTDAFRRALRVLNELGPDAVTGIHNSELTRELLSEIRSDLGSPAPVDED